MDYLQSSYFNPYNPDELRRAGRVLIQEVEYGPLQWLNSHLQQYSFDSNVRFPNVWEGMDGMMEHVYDQFPMPPCTYTQELPNIEPYDATSRDWLEEQPNTEPYDATSRDWLEEQPNIKPYDATSRDWLPYGCSPQQSSRIESEDFSDMYSSCDLVGTFTDTLGYDDRNSKSENTAQSDRPMMEEINFWKSISQLYDKLNKFSKTLSKIRSTVIKSGKKQQTEACRRIKNFYRRLKAIRSSINKKEDEFNRNGYRNIFAMSFQERAQFKRYGIKTKLPTGLKCVRSRFESLITRLRSVLVELVDIIKPHTPILQQVLKDLVPEFSEGEGGLKNNDFSKNSGTVKEPSVDNGVTFNNDQNLLTTSQSNDKVNTSSEFTGKHTDDVEDTDEKEEMEDSDGSAQSEKYWHDSQLLDSSAEITCSYGKSDSKLDCSREENMFWNNLSLLRSKILDTKARTQYLHNRSRRDPTGDGRRVTNRAKCAQTVSMFEEICSFISIFNKLKEEKKSKKFSTKWPLNLDSLKRQQNPNSVPEYISLELVESLLNKLKSAYMRVRREKNKSMQKFGFISDQNDLIFIENEIKKLFRVCAHSESEINVTVMFCSKYSKKRYAPLSEHSRDLHQAASSSKTDKGHGHNQASASCSEVGDDTFDNWRALSENPLRSVDASEGDLWANTSTCYPSGDTGDFRGNIMPTSNLCESTMSKRADFLEQERHHWDRLQRLYMKIEANIKYFQRKSQNFSIGKLETHKTMNTYHSKIQRFFKSLDMEMSESFRAGYCRVVTYKNLDLQPKGCARLLLKNVDKVESRLNTLYEHFRDTAKAFHLSQFYE